MKNLNKKVWVVIATALFLSPALSYAGDMETSSISNSMTMSNEANTADILLKWKIDGYKVTLAWEKYSGSEEVVGYKIIVINPKGEEKTISLWADTTTVDNWDAKAGKNVYQLFVMGTDGEITESNEVVLNMGPNGGYDFGTSQGQYQKPNYGEGYKNQPRPLYGSGLTQEQRTQLEYLKKSLEDNIKTLRESITADNVEEIKTKAENLKNEYLAKAESLGLTEVKKMIEDRFKIFLESNFWLSQEKKEELKKLAEQKKEEMKKLIEQKKEEFDAAKQQGQEQFNQKRDEIKQKMQGLKENFKDKKVDLKIKYKESFAKKLEWKLDNLSAEKLKNILTKIDTLIEKYKANENLKAEQKEKLTAQLQAIKEIIQEKLDELENGINLDELLAE